MTPVEKLQSMIEYKLAVIATLETEVGILRKLQGELKPAHVSTGARGADREAFDKLMRDGPAVGLTVKEIAKALGKTEGTIKAKCWSLHKQGKLTKVSPGRYGYKALPTKGADDEHG